MFFGLLEDRAGLVEGFDRGAEVLGAEVLTGGHEDADAFFGFFFDLLFDDASGIEGGNCCENEDDDQAEKGDTQKVAEVFWRAMMRNVVGFDFGDFAAEVAKLFAALWFAIKEARLRFGILL